MNDRPPHEIKASNETTAAVHAAQQAYDSTVTIFSNSAKVQDFPAHGQILINWDSNNTEQSSTGQVWFNKPDKTLVMAEIGDNLTFQIDTPTGKTPTGEKQYLEFFGQDGKVMSKSVAVGTIMNGLGPQRSPHFVNEF